MMATRARRGFRRLHPREGANMKLCSLAVSLLLLAPSLSSAQVKSGAAMIMLRATLQQSLTMSAMPGVQPFQSFLESGHSAFAMTIDTRWVRGPGSVTFSVVSADGQTEIPLRPDSAPQLTIDLRELPAAGKIPGQVLTVRAQVI